MQLVCDDVIVDDEVASLLYASAGPSKKLKTKLPTSSPAGNINISSMYTQSRQTSERRSGAGMNPRRILTGVRGSRNEVIRRTVYDGALRVEDEPYRVIRDAMADYLWGIDGRSNRTMGISLPPPPTLCARPEWRKLLPLTGFIRPSVNSSFECMMVTELALSEELPSEEMDTDIGVVAPTTATYRKVPILTSPEIDVVSIEQSGIMEDEPLTIRGGGLEDESDSQRNSDEAKVYYSTTHVRPSEENEVVDNQEWNEVVAQPPSEDSEPHAAVPGYVGDSESGKVELEIESTTIRVEDVEVTLTVGSSEEPSENIQQIATASREGELSKETPSRSPQVVATSASADVDSSFVSELDAIDALPPDTKPMVVDLPKAADRPDGFDAVKIPEATRVASVEGVTDVNAPPVQVEAVYSQPSEVYPTFPAAIETRPSITSSFNAEAQVPLSVTQGPSSMAPTTVVTDFESSKSAKGAELSSIMPAICQVVSLPANTRLSHSLNRPNATPSEEDSNCAPALPPWYHPTETSEFEKRTLPEWFNVTAPHRTESTYITTRETMLRIAKCNAQQYITSTAIRRSVAGDAGSLLRLHKFLTDWGLMNGGQIGETAPSNAVLRGVHAENGPLAGAKRKYSQVHQVTGSWSSVRMHALEVSVVKHASKKTDEGNDKIKIIVDWDAVASDVGGGATASECQLAFVNPQTEDAMLDAGDFQSKNWSFSQILGSVHPEVLKAAVEASLQVTNDITKVRKTSFVAVMAGVAAQKCTRIESDIENTLFDIVDQRLQRLENRVALLDDVEALLEAERVSLELERRVMYTARCRHWFGDGSS